MDAPEAGQAVVALLPGDARPAGTLARPVALVPIGAHRVALADAWERDGDEELLSS